MSISLTQIVTDALPLVESQVGEKFDKHTLEKDFRLCNPRTDTSFVDVMPEIVGTWRVKESDILLIECIYHDMHTRCHRFNTVDELESHILGRASFLNWFVSYVIPIVKGKVQSFDVYTKDREKIIKYIFDETSTDELRSNCSIKWRI